MRALCSLAGYQVFDRFNIGLANTGDPNGRSSLVTIDSESNRGEERFDRSRGDRSGNLPNQSAVPAAFDRDVRITLLPGGVLVNDHATYAVAFMDRSWPAVDARKHYVVQSSTAKYPLLIRHVTKAS